MKKIILPAVAIIGLLAMSFTTPTNTAKIELVQTENGAHLTNVSLLSLDDLNQLEELTKSGTFITIVFHQKATKDKIDKTVVYHKGSKKKDGPIDPTDPTTQKLHQIIAKYQ